MSNKDSEERHFIPAARARELGETLYAILEATRAYRDGVEVTGDELENAKLPLTVGDLRDLFEIVDRFLDEHAEECTASANAA